VAKGPKVKNVYTEDHIIFGKYAGTEYPWGSESLLFMREEEVIATLEE
jgi:co-chaperonin GroES (HSP10)